MQSMDLVLSTLEKAPTRDFEIEVVDLIARATGEDEQERASAIAEHTLLRAADVGAVDARLSTFASMPGCLRRTPYARDGLLLAAGAMNFNNMKDADAESVSQALAHLSRLCASAGMAEQSVKIANTLDLYTRAWTFCEILASGAMASDFQPAIASLEDPAARALGFSACAEAWVREGNLFEARRAADLAWSSALSVTQSAALLELAGVKPVKSLEHIGELTEIFSLVADQMRDLERTKSTSAANLVPDQEGEGNMPPKGDGSAAPTKIDPPVRADGTTGEPRSGPAPVEARTLAFGWAAKAFATVGAKEEVFKVGEQLMDQQSETWTVGGLAFANAAHAFKKAGFPENALAAARLAIRAIGARGIDAIASRIAARASADLVAVLGTENLIDLLSILDQVEAPAQRSHLLSSIGSALASIGNHSAAIDVLKRASVAANELSISEEQASALAELAVAFTQAGDQENAMATLRRAFDTARKTSRRCVLNTLATGAAVICALDEGKTLALVGRSIQEIETWWGHSVSKQQAVAG
jgi:tetratricopeptide (TPR) repeat protein